MKMLRLESFAAVCAIAAARFLLPTTVYGDEKSYTEKAKVEQTVTAAGNAAADDRNAFHVLPGYQVEHLFSVPKSELGSWVSIATDNKGRLIVCDQEGKGLCRVTPPPSAAPKRQRLSTWTQRLVPRKGCCTPSIVCTYP